MHPLPAIVWIYPPLTPCQQQKLTREKLFSSGPRECFCHPQRSGVYLAPDTRTSTTPCEIFISATLSKSFLSNRLEFFVHIFSVRFFNPLLIYLRNHKSRKFNWPMLFDIRLAANHPRRAKSALSCPQQGVNEPPHGRFSRSVNKTGSFTPSILRGNVSLNCPPRSDNHATGLTYDPVRLEEDTRTPSLPPRGAFNLCVPLLLATV